MLHEDYIRRLVEKTDDLLDYLWDKAHSGDWICPEIKEAIDLDRLLGLVLTGEAQKSYFPPATRDLAASLLRKWRGEDCDEADSSASSAGESTSQPCSDSESSEGESSTEESEAEGESPSVDLQCQCRANVSGEARTANSTSPSQSTLKPLSRTTHLLHRMRISHRHLHRTRRRNPLLPLTTKSTMLASERLSVDGSVCDHRHRTRHKRTSGRRSKSTSAMFELPVVVSLGGVSRTVLGCVVCEDGRSRGICFGQCLTSRRASG